MNKKCVGTLVLCVIWTFSNVMFVSADEFDDLHLTGDTVSTQISNVKRIRTNDYIKEFRYDDGELHLQTRALNLTIRENECEILS